MLSGWGVSTADYVLYTLVSGTWNVLARLGLPALALLVLLTAGRHLPTSYSTRRRRLPHVAACAHTPATAWATTAGRPQGAGPWLTDQRGADRRPNPYERAPDAVPGPGEFPGSSCGVGRVVAWLSGMMSTVPWMTSPASAVSGRLWLRAYRRSMRNA